MSKGLTVVLAGNDGFIYWLNKKTLDNTVFLLWGRLFSFVNKHATFTIYDYKCIDHESQCNERWKMAYYNGTSLLQCRFSRELVANDLCRILM